MPLQIIRQDITKISCDAIVNPTSETLTPTGGVDLAVHKAAGKKLLEAVRSIGYVNTGEAVITPAFRLKSEYVIHTAGPVWQGGDHNEEALLEACYKNSLNLAKENKCQSVAIPLISSGEYGFPKDRVLRVALGAISDFLFTGEMMVYLVVFDRDSYSLGERLLGHIRSFIDDNYVKMNFVDRPRCAAFPLRREKLSAPPMPMAARVCAVPKNEPQDKDCICESKPPDIDDFIKLDEGFALKLLRLIDLKGMDDVECYKKANVSKQTWYKIMNDKHYKPNKKTAISFAVALGLSLTETQELLESVGFVLSHSSLFDVIIMYCLSNGIYDVCEIDAILFSYDQETLYSKL
ncbi:MAG: macro domain-containing protein [Ruminococcus sp.]|nr:macro domain-containing protein [Ruminococcus sp.]